MKLFLLNLVFLFSIAAPFYASGTPLRNRCPIANRRDTVKIPVSNADLGTFPYFKTLDNFSATDSTTLDLNRTYFYDGKKYLVIDGRISSQNLNIKNSDQKIVGEFGCIDAFDKVVAHLGGVKIYTGKMPEDPLKALTGEDMVSLGGKRNTAPSAYYGVVEYVIKTPEKEVWIQLQPYSLESKFYTLLVVERTSSLISLNSNRKNNVLLAMEKSKKATLRLHFGTDSTDLTTESNADLLQILGVYQAHPDWKLLLESYCASFGNNAYSMALTAKRAETVRKSLIALGVKESSITAKGMGEQKPVQANTTETGRDSNNRFEISLQ